MFENVALIYEPLRHGPVNDFLLRNRLERDHPLLSLVVSAINLPQLIVVQQLKDLKVVDGGLGLVLLIGLHVVEFLRAIRLFVVQRIYGCLSQLIHLLCPHLIFALLVCESCFQALVDF